MQKQIQSFLIAIATPKDAKASKYTPAFTVIVILPKTAITVIATVSITYLGFIG
jgi:hypothetical protein